MERYYQSNENVKERSKRNASLYREIYEEGEYSNIEGIATIEKSNEIDITKVKELLNDRESYKMEREYRNIIKKEPEAEEIPVEDEGTEEKNYDIRDILTKAKALKKDENPYHSLKTAPLESVNQVEEKPLPKDEMAGEENLEELIHTITNTSLLNKMGDKELSLDLLDDLKPTGNTIYDKDGSIRAILDEAKEEDRKKQEKEKPPEMDQSFYTSSLNFNDEDFEEFHEEKKKNRLILKILLFIVLVVITTITMLFIYQRIK